MDLAKTKEIYVCLKGKTWKRRSEFTSNSLTKKILLELSSPSGQPYIFLKIYKEKLVLHDKFIAL